MATFEVFGKRYGSRIVKAVREDQIAEAAGLITEDDLPSSNLGTEIIKIGHALNKLVYKGTKRPLSEEDKEKIAKEIANEIGWQRPIALRRMIKGGSVDALLTMAQQLEALFRALKK